MHLHRAPHINGPIGAPMDCRYVLLPPSLQSTHVDLNQQTRDPKAPETTRPRLFRSTVQHSIIICINMCTVVSLWLSLYPFAPVSRWRAENTGLATQPRSRFPWRPSPQCAEASTTAAARLHTNATSFLRASARICKIRYVTCDGRSFCRLQSSGGCD